MKQWTRHLRNRTVVVAALSLVAFTLASVAWTSSASAATPAVTALSASPETQWTPVGVTWNLTITFLKGFRQGQSETSLMTFLPDGRLTATFPASGVLPAIDGRWHMTAPNAFHYRFKDPIMQNGKMVAFVQVQVDAYLTSQHTYEAGGVGAAYSVTTGQPPIPGQYNTTQTSATVSG